MVVVTIAVTIAIHFFVTVQYFFLFGIFAHIIPKSSGYITFTNASSTYFPSIQVKAYYIALCWLLWNLEEVSSKADEWQLGCCFCCSGCMTGEEVSNCQKNCLLELSARARLKHRLSSFAGMWDFCSICVCFCEVEGLQSNRKVIQVHRRRMQNEHVNKLA